jgi:UDP-N-acetylmuramoyl-tripeptide--D-alanyl-D-alanine ligase
LEVTAHNRLIVDAYNANPTSMRLALENFRDMQADKKMVILGMMGELGNSSHKEHQKMIDLLQELAFDEVWLVGEGFAEIAHPFRQFKDVDEVKAAIQTQQPQGYTILIKGSNSTRLYQLPEVL